MDFIVPLIFLFIVYRVIIFAIKKQTGQNIDWGNVGANIKNAQSTMREISENKGAYGQTTSSRSAQNSSEPKKGTLEHLTQVQNKMVQSANTTSPWVTKASQSHTPSHKRDHVHSSADYDTEKYDAADMFENNSVHANKVLKSCTPAVSKGWRDRGDRGKTVER